MNENKFLSGLWLGHFDLVTLIAMIADMCESVLATRDLATDCEWTEGVVEAAEQLAEAAEGVNVTLAQIATIVAYCETSYGIEATVEALAEYNADPAVVAEAQAMKAKA